MSDNQSQNVPSLTLLSLKTAANIINVASQRNAFKIEELEIVGKTYNEISNFVRLTEERNNSSTNNEVSNSEAVSSEVDSDEVNNEQVNNTSDVNVV